MPFAIPQLERSDRRVGHARLRLSASAGRHRIVNAMEEALRLASLPGENEGRAYYFRRLSLTRLPADGFREVWLQRFQIALLELAAGALHASTPGAAAASAVYFANQHEACEALLLRLVRREQCREWFWPLVVGVQDGKAPQIGPIVERLRSTASSWLAVAQTVLVALKPFEVEAMLEQLNSAAVDNWLEELGGVHAAAPATTTIRLPAVVEPALYRALSRFGAEDSRTLWLVALAVLIASPSEIDSGNVVAYARAILQSALLRWSNPSLPERLLHSATAPELHADDAAWEDDPLAQQPSNRWNEADQISTGASPTNSSRNVPEPSIEPAAPLDAPPAAPLSVWMPERTEAAGLYFIVNALDRLGIASAFKSGLSDAVPAFTARLLNRIADDCGIPARDPIRAWIERELLNREGRDIEASVCQAPWLPAGFAPIRKPATAETYLRIWHIAVRRFCWRSSRLRIAEIVRRKGVVSLNRTDLDISLSLTAVDLRIRRAGLDIDPGWLPWLGCVVRFHYLAERDLNV